MGTHYAPSQDAVRLATFANDAAYGIRQTFGNRHIILCYRGLSGTSMATALMLALFQHGVPKEKIGMFYARKPGEKSHAMFRAYECDNLPEKPSDTDAYIFVDEMICTGETFRAVDKALKEAFKEGRRITHTQTLGAMVSAQYVAGNNALVAGDRPVKEETVVRRTLPKEVKPVKRVVKRPAYPVDPKAVLKLKKKR